MSVFERLITSIYYSDRPYPDPYIAAASGIGPVAGYGGSVSQQQLREEQKPPGSLPSSDRAAGPTTGCPGNSRPRVLVRVSGRQCQAGSIPVLLPATQGIPRLRQKP
ncbi:hypothetical protein E2C01_007755 [Portunus trituberculatus]|uniref:Uncharacterized protein n=1 Tax=Portunus trituberculatus TaxID=210409 RepID=A0A5B7D0Z0_PORTR|nr:hypothetical protein [Portunus trituberculatus]